ncbi:MAG: YciI family protein [Bacteroidota bacterium]|nr:YciI family protein [Bacteroidota bacterium]
MQQYLITAYDFTDSEALNRRMAIRPAHLDGVRKLKQTGNFIIGGAILNPTGQMMGSSMIVAFTSEEELNSYLKTEPYLTGKVWDKVEIKPFRVAEV